MGDRGLHRVAPSACRPINRRRIYGGTIPGLPARLPRHGGRRGVPPLLVSPGPSFVALGHHKSPGVAPQGASSRSLAFGYCNPTG
jgi:hypothetical protein